MPLTLKATRSTIKMQEVQPKLKALQKKHKDDKQTLNTEMMALYSENGINPVGGCLPMVAQLPVFLVLFQVLRGLSRRVSRSAVLFGRRTRPVIQVGSDPGRPICSARRFCRTTVQMFTDLSNETEMGFGPLDLAAEALDVLRDDFLGGLPYVASDLVRGGFELLPATTGLVPTWRECGDESAAGDAAEVLAATFRYLELRVPGRARHLLGHVERVPNRPAGLYHSSVLWREGRGRERYDGLGR